MLQRPQQQHIARSAGNSDKHHRGPPFGIQGRPVGKKILVLRKQGQKQHGSHHGHRRQGQGGISGEIRTIEDRTGSAAKGRRQHHAYADPFAAPRSGQKVLSESGGNARKGKQGAHCLGHTQPFASHCGGNHHGQQRHRGKQQCGPGRGDGTQPQVDQNDQDGKLDYAQADDGQEILSSEMHAPMKGDERRKT
jgi:hypothetical protein